MDYKKIEQILGYTFKDKSLLENALIHSSYTNEHKRKDVVNNERLEFLGDAVLEIVVSDYLYRNNSSSEGDLSKIRAGIVCEKALGAWCIENSLGDFLVLGHGEDLSGGRRRPSVLSDALEAIFGAIYLDSSLEVVYKVIMIVFKDIIKNDDIFIDYKTKLQELSQEHDKLVPSYHLISEKGPDHKKAYVVEVKINSMILATGRGTSKKRAQQNAAENAIKMLENQNNLEVFWSNLIKCKGKRS